MVNRDLVRGSIVKTVNLVLILLFLLCVVMNNEAKADVAYGSSSIVYDTSNNNLSRYAISIIRHTSEHGLCGKVYRRSLWELHRAAATIPERLCKHHAAL